MTYNLSTRWYPSLHTRWRAGMRGECLRSLTSGGMWPRCICPTRTCCCGEGMLPTLKVSGPLEPERITAGSATEPCSTFPVRLNCCCKMVDLQGMGSLGHREVAAHIECRERHHRCHECLLLHAVEASLKEACINRTVNTEAD